MTELQTVEANPLTLLQQAVNSGLDAQQLEKLVALQERWEAREAEKAYNRAMLAMQRELPRVCSDATNTQTHSKYPTETNVRQTIDEMRLKYGFKFFVDEDGPPVDDVICAKLTVSHVDGHKEYMRRYGKVDMYGPKGNPNSTHVQGCQKTVTYLGRRMLLQAFGVVVDGDDRDGNATSEVLTDLELERLDALLNESGADVPLFMQWAGVDRLEAFPRSRYGDAVRMLKTKMAKGEQ